MLVDAVSHSKYWSSTAIFITQDDPQGAWDHINAQRTEAFVISPYTRTSKPQTRSGLYDDNSMLHTIENLLGLPPMSQFDMTAMPMWAGFNRKPDLRPDDMRPIADCGVDQPPATRSAAPATAIVRAAVRTRACEFGCMISQL
jgi:hypothetical protein